jgi:5-phospho-D-xylono-1,4-lactonase
MATLCHEFPGQIMLGMDAARPSYWRSYGGGPGLDFLITQFVPRLQERGLSPTEIEAIFVDNPAQTYTFREKLEQP